MTAREDAAANHRETASGFGRRVEGVQADGWEAQSPVEGWTARDVVRHLITWLPGFLAGGSDVRLEPGPSVDDDPMAAWTSHAEQVQRLLDDPATDGRTHANPHTGEMPLAQAIDQFYTSDVFLHTWDLARATGQDDRLDEQRCRAMYEGMLPFDELLRTSGQYGPRVDVPGDASYQDKLMGFIGRQP
jgi:uncharacterized protein (TIGR03086 family)